MYAYMGFPNPLFQIVTPDLLVTFEHQYANYWTSNKPCPLPSILKLMVRQSVQIALWKTC